MFDPSHHAWADLVFHMLAHLPSQVPASVFDARYVAFSAQHLGPASDLERELAPLRAIACDHARFAALQGLAFLFSTPLEAARFVNRDLAEIAPHEVSDAEFLRSLVAAGPEVEVLRSLAELEAERHGRLPSVEIDRESVTRELERVEKAAPTLGHHTVRCLRSLGVRGRVRKGEIWVGAPVTELGVSARHAAFQAAHEATVSELAEAATSRGFDDRPLEHAALVLFAERARRAGLGADHEAWLAHLSGVPPLAVERLDEPFRSDVVVRLARS